jgi:hypothetical protein
MRIIIVTILIAIFLLQSACYEVQYFGDLRYKDSLRLKEEFDICPYWHDHMTWDEFLQVKNEFRHLGLVKYVDKIEQQKLAQEVGIEVPKTYIATRDKTPIIDIIKPLASYVAKMTHLSFSQGLMIIKNGIDIVSGEAMSLERVQNNLFKNLDLKARDVESWALHQVKPGFMIQEYIPNREEVKIQTVWGTAVIGEWRGGEKNSARTEVWGRYDRSGKEVNGKKNAPPFWVEAVALAEKMALNTDALRVDFLVKRENGHYKLLLNELEIWPESRWSSMKKILAKKLNDGYRGRCVERDKAQ